MEYTTTAQSFPGLLGRGLIEAAGMLGVLLRREPLSPVYWAGASLKRAQLVGSDPAGRPFPGLLGRGLIEASFSVMDVRPAPKLFPRSTGPGPH